MAMKQSGRQYTSMQGKKVDMDLLRQRNELNRSRNALLMHVAMN